MPPTPLSRELAQQAIDLKAKWGTWAEAHRQSGIPQTTLYDRAADARQMGLTPLAATNDAGLLGINENLRTEVERLKALLAEAVKPKFTLRNDKYSDHTDLLAIVMGDAHDSPKIPDKSRFELAGKFAAERKCDLFLSMGDFLDMLSVCFHVPDENYSGRAKPTFLQDIESASLAFDALNSGLGNWNPERHKVQGNHENRLYRIEDSAPSSVGMYVSLYDEMMARAKFTYSPFGATTYYGNVAFTHCPIGIMGKPMGGKQVLPNVGRDAVTDTVTAHTHVPGEFKTRKIGQKHITTVDAGCFLPYGFIEDYAQHTLGGWDWGLTELRIRRGAIESRKWHSLREMEEHYA